MGAEKENNKKDKKDKNKNSNDNENSNLLRKWSPQNKLLDPELNRLEEEAHRTRMDIHMMKEHGKQLKLHRLQALEALETRRVTLTEILRRMDKELNDRDVYEYGDILAEVFGTRKIFAHRAIGLESLLCQFMHQMLAKQHQLKIMKKAAKDIQSNMKKFKMYYKDEYYSFEALTVQLEASRLSLEAMYDDIFTSQHRILAELKHIEAGGEPRKLTKSKDTNEKLNNIPPPINTKNTKSPRRSKGILDASSPNSIASSNNDIDNDYNSAMDVLSTSNDGSNFHDEKKDHEGSSSTSPTRKDKKKNKKSSKKLSTPSFGGQENVPTTKNLDDVSLSPSSQTSPTNSTNNDKGGTTKSARERRRQIEQQRLGRTLPGSSSTSPTNLSNRHHEEEMNIEKSARDRMRELEELATKRRASATKTEQ